MSPSVSLYGTRAFVHELDSEEDSDRDRGCGTVTVTVTGLDRDSAAGSALLSGLAREPERAPAAASESDLRLRASETGRESFLCGVRRLTRTRSPSAGPSPSSDSSYSDSRAAQSHGQPAGERDWCLLVLVQ